MDDKLLQSYFEGTTTDEQSKIVTEWLDASETNMKHYQHLCRLKLLFGVNSRNLFLKSMYRRKEDDFWWSY